MGGRRGQEEHGGGRAGRLFSHTAFLPGSLETAQRPGEVSIGAQALAEAAEKEQGA